MLKNHNIATLADRVGSNAVNIEINHDKTNPEWIKISVGKETATVERKELFGIALLLANEQEMTEVLETGPKKEVEVVQHTRAVTVKATKDIKEGEEVVFNIQYEVPKRIVEYLGGTKEVTE